MLAKLKSSRITPIMSVLVAIIIVVLYSVMSNNEGDNTVYYTELVGYTLAGMLFLLGIWLAQNGKKATAILAGCASLVLSIFVIPCLTAGYKNVPYLLQVLLYAKRIMTMVCPFFATVLLKWVFRVTKGRKYGDALTGLVYFAIAFAVIALLQGAVKWLYFYLYGVDTTWNAIETFYWVVTINIVYIWQMSRNAVGSSEKYGTKVERGRCLIYALIADVAAMVALIWKSYHIRAIVNDFITKLLEIGPAYALRGSTWLSYRGEIFKGIINGEYSVGESMLLANFPDEFPVYVLWTSEPLVSMRLTYGWLVMLVMLILFAVLIALLHAIGCGEKTDDEFGMWVGYSFAALFCLSFVSQIFVPTYGLILPLMGDGACMIALLVVYIAFPKLRLTDYNYAKQ